VSTILGWVSDIRLSLKQIAALSLATLIGGLLVALRLQGTKIHRLQTELLELRFHSTMDQQDARVEAAETAFKKALSDYHNAGGE
jgi:hypothetical protein